MGKYSTINVRKYLSISLQFLFFLIYYWYFL